MTSEVKELIATVKRFKELWKKMKDIGGQVTEPLSKLLKMEKDLAEALAASPAPGRWELKYCDKEYREIYEAANWQRHHLEPLASKKAAYWIEFSGASVGGAAGAGEMVQKSEQSLFKLLEARQNFEDLKAAAEGAAVVLEAMKVLEFFNTGMDLSKMAPDAVRTAANLQAGKEAYYACKGCVAYIDQITPPLDKAIDVVTDLDNEIHRFYKNLTSKYTFLDLLKMYAEEQKKKKPQAAGK